MDRGRRGRRGNLSCLGWTWHIDPRRSSTIAARSLLLISYNRNDIMEKGKEKI